MYRLQYKINNPFEAWKSGGSFGSEQAAISAALNRKRQGALLVRVLDKKKTIVYTN